MLDLGDVKVLQVEVRNEAGALENAGSMVLTVTLPDGTTVTPAYTNTSPGVYRCNYQTVQAGRHVARWLATGVNASAYVDVFDAADPAWGAIVSLADAKAQLRVTSTAGDEDLRRFVGSATRVVEHYVGSVVRRTITEKHHGEGCAVVLRQSPVISVTSVVESGTTLTTDQYSLSDAGVLYRLSGPNPYPWYPGVNNVVLTYVAGRTAVPSNQYTAAMVIIQHLWESRRGPSQPQFAGAAEDTVMVPGLGFAVPRRAVELLEPDQQVGGVA